MNAPNESDTSPSIVTLLEVAAAASAVMRWGVVAVPSLGRVFAWDARPDASGAILEAVAGQEGRVVESASIEAYGQTIIGVLIAPPTDSLPLEELEGVVKLRYAIATGPDPKDTKNPW